MVNELWQALVGVLAGIVGYAVVKKRRDVTSKPRVVLHFDVNKTVIMVDPIQGKFIDEMMNDIVSEYTYGRISGEGDEMKWTWDGEKPTSAILKDTDLVTYADFMHKKYPDRKREKKQRTKHKKAFTLDGHPGSGVRDKKEELYEAMMVPDSIKDDPEAKELGIESHHHIIPAFFELLIHLKKEKRDFSIVFRTFGDDLETVAKELNVFCEGRHPLYPDIKMDGSDGYPDMRLHLSEPSSFGVTHRSSSHLALIMGTLKGADDPLHDSLDFYRDLQKQTQAEAEAETAAGGDSEIEIVQGAEEAYLHIHQALEKHNVIGIRDHYYWWRENSEAASAGKLFLIDRLNPNLHEIFIDDNIYVDVEDAHIVDCRDMHTGETLQFEEIYGLHIVKCVPLDAIPDQNYFVKMIENCEKRRVDVQ